MEDEVLRQKYRDLQSKLYNIENKLEDLNDCYGELKTLIKDSLLVDDKMVEQSIFDSVLKDSNNIHSEIVNGLIPRINNKI